MTRVSFFAVENSSIEKMRERVTERERESPQGKTERERVREIETGRERESEMEDDR